MTTRIVTRARTITTTSINSKPVVKKTKTTTNTLATTSTTTATTTKKVKKTTTEQQGNLLGDGKKRCNWIESIGSKHQNYIQYHDEEWGVENRDSLRLFEKLCLEGQLAGLSWLTVLNKRQNYRRCFYNFNPSLIVKNITNKVIEDELMKDAGIIRNRLKINAIIENAKSYLKMVEKGEDFSKYIWSFNKGQTTIGARSAEGRPLTTNAASDEMAKSLKKLGFRFVGSTTCYAFMQSVGIINDHCKTCHFNPSSKSSSTLSK